MGDCLSRERQQNSPYTRLEEGYRYNAMDNRNGGNLLSSSSSSSNNTEEHPPHEQASNKERELQNQLDIARRELAEERERAWSNKTELQLTLSAIEREVCEYKNQLVLVKNCLESEDRDWETVRARLETQIERERLKIRSRDVQIHQLKLAKEQETAALSNQLIATTHQFQTENRALREQLRQLTMTNQPDH